MWKRLWSGGCQPPCPVSQALQRGFGLHRVSIAFLSCLGDGAGELTDSSMLEQAQVEGKQTHPQT